MVGGLNGKSVFVTGASGFIGGRLVERLLLEEGARVRALAHRPPSAVWLSRTTAELVWGDVDEVEGLARLIKGCDIVVHCAAMMGGDARAMHRTNVTGTENLLEAAAEAGVARFVHLSSLAVHGNDFPDGADETTPLRPGPDPYSQTKLASEEVVARRHEAGRVPAVIVRPSIVYGPRSQIWTLAPVDRIRRHRLALYGPGDGVANVVFIDDLVSALIRAATVPGIEGETFLISSEERVTWRDFYGAYARMAGARLPGWPRPAALAAGAYGRLLGRWIDRLQGGVAGPAGARAYLLLSLMATRKLSGPALKLGLGEIALYRGKSQVSVAKAKRLLGYRTEWTLERAMAATEAWLRAQGYLSA
jgi:nucleoside-diphosphate-sugar epimerase